MDPSMEFRLLRREDSTEFASNWTADEALVPEGAVEGAFVGGPAESHTALLSPSLRLEPHKRYRLDLDYRGTFAPSTLSFSGKSMNREYALPSAGNARGFGVSPGNNHSLTFFTSGDSPENIDLVWISPDLGSPAEKTFADFRFHELDQTKLPVNLESLIPLKAHLRSAEPAFLETPRMFIEGYIALVNGVRVRPLMSPDRLLMVPVRAGESDVVVAYRGPYALRLSFWISFYAWLSFFVVGSVWALFPVASDRIAVVALEKTGKIVYRHRRILVGGLLLCAVVAYGWSRWQDYVHAVGPLRIRLELPRGQPGRAQPILTTGRREAGTFVFVIFKDSTHVRIGVDVWNKALFLSEPVEVDYYYDQYVVVTTGALFPQDHPALRHLSAAQLERLRNQIKVELNGKTVIDQAIFSYDSKMSEVNVGESRIGGSNTEPVFVGKILKVERLPVPSNSE